MVEKVANFLLKNDDVKLDILYPISPFSLDFFVYCNFIFKKLMQMKETSQFFQEMTLSNVL